MAKRIKNLLNDIRSDLPKCKLSIKLIIYYYLFNAQFRLSLNYRIGNYLVHSKIKKVHLIADYYKYRQITKRNCQIGYYAHIGKSVYFGHPIGIVIGEGVKIADNVTIYQNVTIGSSGNPEKMPGYPEIESGVTIFPGSVIVGNIRIGEKSIIGANSFVNNDIPPNSFAAGQPAQIIRTITEI
jgi:serine O-acetyltransferase